MSRVEKWMLSELNRPEHGARTTAAAIASRWVGAQVFRLLEADWPRSLGSLCYQ
jgi:hypothetical protein